MGRTSDARDRLVDAAIDLIWSSSYGAVSVDQICERAGVKKGSFYHFFPSKTDLAADAYETCWARTIQPILEAAFAPDVPPLERFERWCAGIYAHQLELTRTVGHVPGCPFTTLGIEMGAQNERLRQTAEELMQRGLSLLERALADGHRDGSIHAPDVPAKARAIVALMLGMTMQAKVQNDVEVLRELYPLLRDLLTSPSARPAALPTSANVR